MSASVLTQGAPGRVDKPYLSLFWKQFVQINQKEKHKLDATRD